MEQRGKYSDTQTGRKESLTEDGTAQLAQARKDESNRGRIF
jgi:hypothetical protein